MRKMVRKTLALSIALVLTVGLTTYGARQGSSASAAEPVKIRFGMNFVSAHPIALGFERMAKRLSERTNGALVLLLYPGEQLGNGNDMLNAVSTDTLDLAIGGVGMVSNRLPALKIFDCPYIFRDPRHLLNFCASDVVKALWDELASLDNIRNVGVIYNGSRQLTTGKVPVRTPADLKGLKLRVPDEPMGLAYGRAMGGQPTPMTFGEVYLGLQQGVIDGQENPLTNIIDGKFYEVQRYLSLTGHILATQAVMMSDASLKRLPDNLRAVFMDEMGTTVAELSDLIQRTEQENLQFLKDKGMEVIQPDIEAFKKACLVVVDQFKGQWGEDMYEVVQKY